jgi:hypothetical protein
MKSKNIELARFTHPAGGFQVIQPPVLGPDDHVGHAILVPDDHRRAGRVTGQDAGGAGAAGSTGGLACPARGSLSNLGPPESPLPLLTLGPRLSFLPVPFPFGRSLRVYPES